MFGKANMGRQWISTAVTFKHAYHVTESMYIVFPMVKLVSCLSRRTPLNKTERHHDVDEYDVVDEICIITGAIQIGISSVNHRLGVN